MFGAHASYKAPWRGLLGLVQELHLRGDVGGAVGTAAPKAGQGTGDTRVAAEDPAGSRRIDIREHQLEGPRPGGIGAAPDVVDTGIERLARRPGAQRARWVGGVQIPPAQDVLDGKLVPAQHEHIKVIVLPSLVSHEQIDRPTPGDPPGEVRAGEQ